VVPLVVVAVISAGIAGRGAVAWDKIAALILAGGLASAGAACLNHYLDRDMDAIMQRTRRRPIPSGRISNPATAAALGFALIGLAVTLATKLSLASMVFIALGAFFYVVVYTWWLKRTSPLNVVIGGFAGSCAALAGWTAVDPTITLTPAFLALFVFLWTPSHFWSLAIALKDDYRTAGVPMLPVLVGERVTSWIILANNTMLFVASLLPYFLGLFGWPYLVAVLAAGAVGLLGSIRLVRRPERPVAWRNYKISGIYLGLLFVGMLVDVLV
jgi:heme o synthase